MLDEERYNDMAHWAGLDRSWYVSGRPYREMDRIDGMPNPIYRRWLDHPAYDSYRQQMTPYREEFSRIDFPVLQTTGYYDGTGKDVSDESIADAGEPLRVQWFSTSFVEFPIG